MNSEKRFLKLVLVLIFLVILTGISFTKEWKNTYAYSDEQLNAEIVSNTAPNIVNKKNVYTISITVKNTGGGVWTKDTGIRLCIWQDELDWGYRVDLPDEIQIESEEQYTFVLEGFSVSDKNSTKLEFQMVKEGFAYFGEREAVTIKAVGS